LALATPLDEEQRDYIQTIGNSAESLLEIINDILDYSKIEAGKLELACEPFPLRECLNDALRAIAVKAHEKQLELTWRVARGVPGVLLGDAGKLRQIILNLVGNAIKFTERGEVELLVRRELAETPVSDISNCTLHFSVRDTGIGIAADQQALVFDEFTQADGSRTRKHGGTGLGLAITSRLVSLMNGRIWVESTLGVGSTFHFLARFGVSRTTPELTSPVTSQVAAIVRAKRSLTVLVAEDNSVNQRVAQRLLQKMGHTVVLAGNGREAVEAVQRGHFDVILMDVQMPEVDGYEATARIREYEAHDGRAHVPIIATTAHAMSGDRELCLQSGMDTYVSKPINAAELAAVIQQLCLSEPSAVADGFALRSENPPTTADGTDNSRTLRDVIARPSPSREPAPSRADSRRADRKLDT
jgi:CheY-like chemotaxis protein/anti-sigma regulatory factor (Ser/Thr protein kinase)